MLTKPGSKAGLIETSTRQGEDCGDDLFLGGFRAEAIQAEEEIHGLEGDALVAVHERVVLGEAEAVCCSQSGKVGVGFVPEPVARTFEGRLQEPTVPEAERPPVSLDLIGMDRENVNEGEPARFDHFASSRMALR